MPVIYKIMVCCSGVYKGIRYL